MQPDRRRDGYETKDEIRTERDDLRKRLEAVRGERDEIKAGASLAVLFKEAAEGELEEVKNEKGRLHAAVLRLVDALDAVGPPGHPCHSAVDDVREVLDPAPARESEEQMGKATETIYSDGKVVIAMADVQHVEKAYHDRDLVDGAKKGDLLGSQVITKHTKWSMEADCWENAIWLSDEQTPKFLSAWCRYRHEIDDLADIHPIEPAGEDGG